MTSATSGHDQFDGWKRVRRLTLDGWKTSEDHVPLAGRFVGPTNWKRVGDNEIYMKIVK